MSSPVREVNLLQPLSLPHLVAHQEEPLRRLGPHPHTPFRRSLLHRPMRKHEDKETYDNFDHQLTK